MSYLREHTRVATPQNEPLPGQAENSAGGFAWAVDEWTRLRRFLILGTEGGSYYADERDLTRESLDAVRACLASDGERLVNEVVAVSDEGRAPKNDPAILALALAAAEGDATTRAFALQSLPAVCRIGTHLFMFAEFVQSFRGWGRGLRRAVGNWYEEKEPDALAYQLVKYRQRAGWTHRDLLRLAHPSGRTPEHKHLYDWVVGRTPDSLPTVIAAYEAAQTAKGAELVGLARQLPREALPTEALREARVWDALLAEMPMTAMIRNLATMTRVGLIAPMSGATRTVTERLADGERIRRARIHPIAVLAALTTYASGHSARGSATWDPVREIIDALDGAFYLAFGNVEATGRRTMLALDVSGSMGWGEIAGVPGLTPRDASAAMALVTAAVEPNYEIMGFSTEFIPLEISPRQRLSDAVQAVSDLPFGGTDCALPILYAQAKAREIDSFVVYTDSETWAGGIHPSQALRDYRKGFPSARLAVVGMVSNGFSIADPNDPGMLDVVGFDTATPQVLADFGSGRL